jgi:uncharacterized protein YndB with AHSA1/START domain
MNTSLIPAIDPKLDLVLERIVDVPPALVWKAWTEPKHLMPWFCPLPWKTVECEIDLRPGGIFKTVMQSPEGELHPGTGCYLEVIPGRKLVWTDALLPGYRPAGSAFMTGIVVIEPHGPGTKYTAMALHSDEATRVKHEEMGFHGGWSTALDQLVAYAKGMSANS